jgi:hypothetical protein
MALRLLQELVYVVLDDLEYTVNQKFTEAYYNHTAATTSTGSDSSECRS